MSKRCIMFHELEIKYERVADKKPKTRNEH